MTDRSTTCISAPSRTNKPHCAPAAILAVAGNRLVHEIGPTVDRRVELSCGKPGKGQGCAARVFKLSRRPPSLLRPIRDGSIRCYRRIKHTQLTTNRPRSVKE